MTVQHLFGTSGIRGDAINLFTNQFSFDLGRTFAVFLKKHRQFGPVAVGMDPRKSGPRIKKFFIAGSKQEGRECFDEGIVPIPALNWLLKTTNIVGSAMITGSHINADLNGIKFFAFEEEISKKHEAETEGYYQQLKKKNPCPSEIREIPQDNRAEKDYKKMLFDLVEKPFPSWKVIVDPGNGAQFKVMPELLKEMGFEVIALNDSLDQPFIARDTETEGCLKPLQEEVVKRKAFFGIAFDPDGDRVVFVDEKGRFIPGDYTGALISKYGNTPTVVTPINTSQVVNHLNKPVIRTKVGSPYVVEAMKKNGATFGFEANGGGISSEIMFSRDAGSTTIKILNLLKNLKTTFSGLVNMLPWFYLVRNKVDCPSSLNPLVIKEAKKDFKGIKGEELDGLKIWLDKSTWILFRPSSNTQEFRVFVESKDLKNSENLAKMGMALVKKVIRQFKKTPSEVEGMN